MLDPNGIFIGGGGSYERRPVLLSEPVNGLVTNKGAITEVSSRFIPVMPEGSTAFAEGQRSPIPGDSEENLSVIATREYNTDVLAVKVEVFEDIVEIDNAVLGLDGEPLLTLGGDPWVGVEESGE